MEGTNATIASTAASPGAHGERRSCESTVMGQPALFLLYGCFCRTGEKLCPSASPCDMARNRKANGPTLTGSEKQLRLWLCPLQGPKHLAASSNWSQLCPWHPAPRTCCLLQCLALSPAGSALRTALSVHPARYEHPGGAGNRWGLEDGGRRRQWGLCPAKGEDVWGGSKCTQPCHPPCLFSSGLQSCLQPL